MGSELILHYRWRTIVTFLCTLKLFIYYNNSGNSRKYPITSDGLKRICVCGRISGLNAVSEFMSKCRHSDIVPFKCTLKVFMQ